jgi:hypothetical protein
MSQDIPKNLQTPPLELKTTFDIIWIIENVKAVSDKINQMELEGTTDPFDFEMAIIDSHPEFYQSHPFLVKRLCKRGDMSMLYKMLEQLEKVESGNKSLAGVELNLGEELANQYLYPVVNKNKNKKK